MLDHDRLVGFSNHVHYEIWMMRLADRLMKGYPSGSERTSGHSEARVVEIGPVRHTTVAEPQYSSDARSLPVFDVGKEDKEAKTVIGNALVESFAIHVRGLLDFFYKDEPTKKDVLAVDYFPDVVTWHLHRPEVSSKVITRIKDRVDTEVAHLTSERLNVTDEMKAWDRREMKKIVMDAAHAFQDHVDQKNLSDWWRNHRVP